jgi:hypothetical protein
LERICTQDGDCEAADQDALPELPDGEGSDDEAPEGDENGPGDGPGEGDGGADQE